MTAVKNAFVFSGQGSQYFQMGRHFYDRNPVFRSEMLIMDQWVTQLTGRSVVRALYAGARSRVDIFDETILTHPAIFMVEYALARAVIVAGVKPQLTLGVSLGAFAAAAVSGFVDAKTALTAVISQASTCEAYCPPGGMIVVLADMAHYDRELSSLAVLAAVNSRSHFVLSALRESCDTIEGILRNREVAFARLPISYAFHSQWIDAARQPYETFLRSFSSKAGEVPMMCSAQAAILIRIPQNYFWYVARQPILFREAVAGIAPGDRYRFIDLGPAGSLALLLNQFPRSPAVVGAYSVMSPYGRDQENFAAVVHQCKTVTAASVGTD